MSIAGVKSVREVTNEQYAEAYQKYRPCLYKTSKTWIKKFGEDEALHIAGIALWRALQSYDQSRNMAFLSYLINCIRWSFLDHNDFLKRFSREEPVGGVDYLPPEPSFEPPVNALELDDRPEVIKPHLNDKARAIVDLVVQGKNPTEISQEIRVSRQRVHQIFNDIRHTYNKLSRAGKI